MRSASNDLAFRTVILKRTPKGVSVGHQAAALGPERGTDIVHFAVTRVPDDVTAADVLDAFRQSRSRTYFVTYETLISSRAKCSA